MPLSNGLVARRVLPIVTERMQDDPVVLLEGPRSVGKSTLLQHLAHTMGAVLLDLDVPATRDAVAVDPSTFVAGPEPVCVDEYQKAPVVLDAIKAELNRDSRPGRSVLTGSTRHDSLPAAGQALTGGLSRLTVYPLAQVELEGNRSSILQQLFADPAATVASKPTSTTTREDYVQRVVAGGFPMALARRTANARSRWLDDYRPGPGAVEVEATAGWRGPSDDVEEPVAEGLRGGSAEYHPRSGGLSASRDRPATKDRG